jgi:hypothetical protein
MAILALVANKWYNTVTVSIEERQLYFKKGD